MAGLRICPGVVHVALQALCHGGGDDGFRARRNGYPVFRNGPPLPVRDEYPGWECSAFRNRLPSGTAQATPPVPKSQRDPPRVPTECCDRRDRRLMKVAKRDLIDQA